MRVVSQRRFRDAAALYPNEGAALLRVSKALNDGRFITPDVLKATFPSLDRFKYRDKWWVIDIGGNNLRLIAYISFESQELFVKHIVTHKEYDRLTDHYRSNKQ
ncbi:type II toxin-antitoxin system HigB family toxin [Erwinia billingiae]|jgi:mRNA interferase HigB|uniref:type II toxin-antitoxin system HigB family toxin n=1 Tax=Erwinia billingiae TaxID=182337 RepID=UPI00069E14CC|nr:type II toxin-antitoxin system HigB family toxin [Erwinia billingiae]